MGKGGMMGYLKLIKTRWLMMAEKNTWHFEILHGQNGSGHALALVGGSGYPKEKSLNRFSERSIHEPAGLLFMRQAA